MPSLIPPSLSPTCLLFCVIDYRKDWTSIGKYPALSVIPISKVSELALSDSEHLSAACGAYTLSCRFAILHSYGLGVLHFPFGTAFHTVSLHVGTSFLLCIEAKPFTILMSSGLLL